MFNGKLNKYRGLLISITALVVFFLVYLVVNGAIQRQANQSAFFAGTVNAIASKISDLAPGDADALNQLKTQVQAITDGRPVAGLTSVAADPIDKFLAPETSSIGQVLSALNASDLAAAKSGFSAVSTKVQKYKTKLKNVHR